MQQFIPLVAASVLICSSAVAQTAADPCGSSVIFKDLDLSKPVIEEPTNQHSARGFTTVVPIETALPGLANTPRAFAGAVVVDIPGPGPADLPAECQPNLLNAGDKPIAPE